MFETAEQDRRKRRRQGQSIEGGDRDGKGDGQRELAEQDASRAGEECDRHEYRNEYERGGDDRAGDFSHGGGGGFGGAGLALLQVALDVLDYDNHVVDNQPGRESNAEKRERVDGEAKQLDECKCADERNWNGDGRE